MEGPGFGRPLPPPGPCSVFQAPPGVVALVDRVSRRCHPDLATLRPKRRRYSETLAPTSSPPNRELWEVVAAR